MSANSLLLWMSARGEGSWAQFRAAVEELHLADNGDDAEDSDSEDLADETGLPLYHLLRLNLQRLGHAEFGAGAADNDWKVTPPCLAVTARPGGWRGVLAGARSRNLLSRVLEHGQMAGLETVSVRACPDVLRFDSQTAGMLTEIAGRMGVYVQPDAATALLMSLPPVDDRSMLREIPIPFGNEWKIERFSVETLGWKPALQAEVGESESGLFRFSFSYRRHVLLRVKDRTFEVPIQVGKYMVLRRRARRTLRYDASAGELTVPASCRPPFLVERALIACSGLLPTYRPANGRTGMLHYGDIPPGIAQLAASVLRQELR